MIGRSSADETPARPAVRAVPDDTSTMTNTMTAISSNSFECLNSLKDIVFRSHDPTVAILLHETLRGEHDAGLIKTDNDQWCDNIIDNLRNYITNSFFQRYVSQDMENLRKMFFYNIHFGKTGDPDNGSRILQDMQLRAMKKM